MGFGFGVLGFLRTASATFDGKFDGTVVTDLVLACMISCLGLSKARM